MKLRPYQHSDHGPLAELWLESWLSVGLEGHGETRDELAARVERELASRWTVTVAEADGRLLGFMALAEDEERLDQLFIAPDAKRRGIGRQLLNIAKGRLPRGFWLRTQADNAAARAFYEREGLQLDRLELSDGGERAIYVFRPDGS